MTDCQRAHHQATAAGSSVHDYAHHLRHVSSASVDDDDPLPAEPRKPIKPAEADELQRTSVEINRAMVGFFAGESRSWFRLFKRMDEDASGAIVHAIMRCTYSIEYGAYTVVCERMRINADHFPPRWQGRYTSRAQARSPTTSWHTSSDASSASRERRSPTGAYRRGQRARMPHRLAATAVQFILLATHICGAYIFARLLRSVWLSLDPAGVGYINAGDFGRFMRLGEYAIRDAEMAKRGTRQRGGTIAPWDELVHESWHKLLDDKARRPPPHT